MNRFFVIFFTLITMTGCGAVGTMSAPSGTRPVLFLQRGVMLQVFNNCTTSPAKLYPSHPAPGQAEVLIPPGPPTWVPMAPMPLMATDNVSATLHLFEGGVLVGTVSRSFRIDRYSTQTIQWVVGGERGGGGRGVVIDRCPRALDRR